MFECSFSPFRISKGNIYYQRDIAIPSDFYPNHPYIFRALMYRKVLNMNTFIVIVGNPRSSKSYCALKIAETYSEMNNMEFDVEKQLAFDDVKKFFEWSRDARDSIFILDESGTTLSPDQFWTVHQRVMRRFCQTKGFLKNVLIWNLPSILLIQRAFRGLANYAIRTLRQGRIEVHKMVVNQLTGDQFPQRIETMNFSLPSAETIVKYERMKSEWNKEDLEDSIKTMEEMERPDKKLFGYRAYLSFFENGLINSQELHKFLLRIGYDEFSVELMIKNTEKEREEKIAMKEMRNKVPLKEFKEELHFAELKI